MTVGNVLVGKEVQGSAVGPSCKNDHIVVWNESVGNVTAQIFRLLFNNELPKSNMNDINQKLRNKNNNINV